MAREIVYSEDGVINARVKQKVDSLADWEANDMTILEGEQAFVTAPDGTPVNFKIGDGTKPFRDLPFWLDSGSPFKLRSTDTEYVQVTGGNTIVTHPGLIGFDDYPVTTTQLNIACFRDSDLTYDAINGKVTIIGFELQSGELLILAPPSMKWAATTGSGSAIAELVARVEELERKAAPFTVNETTGESSARVWWTRPIAEIPNGWVIDTDWNGRVPVGYDASATEFNVMGKTGGNKTVALTAANNGPHTHDVVLPRRSAQGNDNMHRFISYDPTSVGTSTFTTESSGQGQPFNIINPYRVGCWIKYVGV